jgi:hypothetical protein
MILPAEVLQEEHPTEEALQVKLILEDILHQKVIKEEHQEMLNSKLQVAEVLAKLDNQQLVVLMDQEEMVEMVQQILLMELVKLTLAVVVAEATLLHLEDQEELVVEETELIHKVEMDNQAEMR